jgi:hypothetical protein
MFALTGMLAEESRADQRPLLKPHFKPKVKRIVFCYMDGGVSHVDSFDPKPKLTELHGKEVGRVDNVTAGGLRRWLRTPFTFKQYGQSGMPISELFPHIATVADELAVIRSMKGEFPLHSRGNLLLHTGRNTGGLPSIGSWVTYGLGSENQNLPGFVVLNHRNFVPAGGMENFSNGFLPARHQATFLEANGTPIPNLSPSDKQNEVQKAKLALLAQQDKQYSNTLGGDDAIESAIENYELAYRMQSLVPDVLDLNKESEATKKLYGLDSSDGNKKLYGLQCLRARRLLESGVRFVEVCCPNIFGATGTWDQHGNLKKGHETNAMVTDQAVAALIKDLKQRGMLEDTLVLWAGEFGRTPHSAGNDGRDHHPEGFSVWMAGGGIKGGTIYGATDEMGMFSVENICTFHDLHATMLHLLGMDHTRLTFRFGGRDYRLTDVHGKVVRPILA